MPIVSEKSEGSRRVARRWLAGSGVFLGLLLLLPLVPFMTPVTLHAGDRWVEVYTRCDIYPPDPLEVGGRDIPADTEFAWTPSSDLSRPSRHVIFDFSPEEFHQRWVAFGRLLYGIRWGRADRDQRH